MPRLSYVGAARADLTDIWRYYASKGDLCAADGVVDRIQATIRRTILTLLKAGRSRPEFGEGIRSFPIVPYVVFYRVQKQNVEILRVLHGHHDIRAPLMSLFVA